MKKLIAFMLCFTVLAVGVTYGCIQYTLRAPVSEEAMEQGIDLNGFYDENDLRVTEIRQDSGDVYISYPQFDGLKNAEVQTAVNDLIVSEAERLKQQDIDAGGDVRYLSYNVSGSFANVLSVGLYSAQEQVYLNFNLNDGSLLQLSDLFAQNADLQGIVHGAFYNTMTIHNLGNHYWEKVNSPDENALYKTVRAYLAGARNFLFTPSEIHLYYENYMASIQMTEHAEDIVIYGKYLSEESLFTEDGIGGDGMFTCANLRGGYANRSFGFAADNFWYDIAMPEPYFSEQIPAEHTEAFRSFCDDLYAELLAEADTIRTQALEHPDRAYILLTSPEVHMHFASEQVGNEWKEIPSSAAELNKNYVLYEMSAERFESKYRQALMDVYRSNTYSLFFGVFDEYIDGGEVQSTTDRSYALYNYETGEPVTLDTLFIDGYDYMDFIRRDQKFALTSYYGYTLESAELALQNAWCELEGSGVGVYLPEWGREQRLYMALSQFPRNVLKIFE